MTIVSAGEILWDVIGDAEHLGGAPFNLAAHARRLGHDVLFVSAVGADERGRRALERMAASYKIIYSPPRAVLALILSTLPEKDETLVGLIRCTCTSPYSQSYRSRFSVASDPTVGWSMALQRRLLPQGYIILGTAQGTALGPQACRDPGTRGARRTNRTPGSPGW